MPTTSPDCARRSDRRPRRSTPRRWAIPSSTSSTSRSSRKIAHENGVPLVIDNTTPSPALCRPIEWGATSSSTRRPSSSAGTALPSAESSSTPASSTGPPRDVQGFRRARSVVSRRVLHQRFRAAGVHHQGAGARAARYRSGAVAVQRVPVAARRRDAASAHGAAFAERAEGRRVPGGPRRCGVGELSRAADQQVLPAGEEVSSRVGAVRW